MQLLCQSCHPSAMHALKSVLYDDQFSLNEIFIEAVCKVLCGDRISTSLAFFLLP